MEVHLSSTLSFDQFLLWPELHLRLSSEEGKSLWPRANVSHPWILIWISAASRAIAIFCVCVRCVFSDFV